MRSMTGYSKLSYQDDKYALNMELKSVNNKNLNLKIKLPYNLNFLEGAIRTEIASKVSRGSLDLKIEFSDLRDLGKLFDYDKEQSKGYMNVLLEMEKDFNEKFSNKMEGSQRKWPIKSVFFICTFCHLLGTLTCKITRTDCRYPGEHQK